MQEDLDWDTHVAKKTVNKLSWIAFPVSSESGTSTNTGISLTIDSTELRSSGLGTQLFSSNSTIYFFSDSR